MSWHFKLLQVTSSLLAQVRGVAFWFHLLWTLHGLRFAVTQLFANSALSSSASRCVDFLRYMFPLVKTATGHLCVPPFTVCILDVWSSASTTYLLLGVVEVRHRLWVCLGGARSCGTHSFFLARFSTFGVEQLRFPQVCRTGCINIVLVYCVRRFIHSFAALLLRIAEYDSFL